MHYKYTFGHFSLFDPFPLSANFPILPVLPNRDKTCPISNHLFVIPLK